MNYKVWWYRRRPSKVSQSWWRMVFGNAKASFSLLRALPWAAIVLVANLPIAGEALQAAVSFKRAPHAPNWQIIALAIVLVFAARCIAAALTFAFCHLLHLNQCAPMAELCAFPKQTKALAPHLVPSVARAAPIPLLCKVPGRMSKIVEAIATVIDCLL